MTPLSQRYMLFVLFFLLYIFGMFVQPQLLRLNGLFANHISLTWETCQVFNLDLCSLIANHTLLGESYFFCGPVAETPPTPHNNTKHSSVFNLDPAVLLPINLLRDTFYVFNRSHCGSHSQGVGHIYAFNLDPAVYCQLYSPSERHIFTLYLAWTLRFHCLLLSCWQYIYFMLLISCQVNFSRYCFFLLFLTFFVIISFFTHCIGVWDRYMTALCDIDTGYQVANGEKRAQSFSKLSIFCIFIFYV